MKRLAIVLLLCFSSLSFIGQTEGDGKKKPRLRKLKNYKHWANDAESSSEEKPKEEAKPREKPRLRIRPGKRRVMKPVKEKVSNEEKYRQQRKKRKKIKEVRN